MNLWIYYLSAAHGFFYFINLTKTFEMQKARVNSVKKVAWHNDQVTFEISDSSIWVNATEMAKPFNKKPDNFLRNQQTQDYIEALCRFSNLRNEDVIKVIQGGIEQGTWLHQKLALRFAQWLSPEFSIWVDEQIENLLYQKPEPFISSGLLNETSFFLPIFITKTELKNNQTYYEINYSKEVVSKTDLIQCSFLISKLIAEYFK